MPDENVPAPAPVPGAEDDLEIVAACPLCNSTDHRIEVDHVQDINYGMDAGLFTFLRCNECRSLWLRERPIGTRLQRAYAGYYTHAEPEAEADVTPVKSIVRSLYIRSRYGRASGAVSSLLSFARKLAGKDHFGIDRQYRFVPKAPAKVLDYGCGSGAYLLRLQPLGLELHGLEYDPQLIGRLAEHGISVGDVSAIDDQHWHEEFDHITLAHVLEHVPDPQSLLARLFNWLKPGGTLFVELPNGAALGLDVFGRNWRCLETPRHFALPSRLALVDALHRAGFVDTKQYVEPNMRNVMWRLSLAGCPPEQRSTFAAAVAAAGAQTPDNTEYLTFTAAKPGAR